VNNPPDRPVAPPNPLPERPDTVRRRLLGLPLAWVAAGAGAATQASSARAPVTQALVFPPESTPLRFELDIDTRAPGTPVNRRVLGSNVQWVYGGDDMLGADDRFDARMLALARTLAPTVLRYPGGAQSDAYHWERGVGPMAARGPNEHVNARAPQLTRLGTREFLELCEATGAAPLLTLNLATGTPEEAARWMHATDVERFTSTLTGRPLPKVAFWELGNEPYLTQERPDLAVAPAEFARRADRFISALRAIEPDAVIGLPLTMDRRNGVPTTHVFGFTSQVLAGITGRIDFVSVHDAYMPFGGKDADPAALYWAAMAATRTVRADMDAMQRVLHAWRPAVALPLAVTEYSALFSLGAGATDGWIATPAAGLYAADALRLFASSPDVLLANQWSLSANWVFGAINAHGFTRPVYTAMQWMGQALHGERVAPAAMRSDTVATPSVGLSAAVAALPLVEPLVTRERAGDATTWRIALIQKDPRRGAQGRISLAGLGPALVRSVRLESWHAPDVFDASDERALWQHARHDLPVASTFTVQLPPASLALLTITLSS
jgi:alpha-N-arabinofuranosidase